MQTVLKFSQHIIVPIDKKTYAAWGCGCRGRIGNGSESHVFLPEIFKTTFVIKKVSCGSSHTVFLDDVGNAYGAGLNMYGALGLGTQDDFLRPTVIPLNDVVDVFCGYHISYFITSDGSLYASGRNHVGQLGLGHFENVTNPVKIDGVDHVVSISCGGYHSFAITESGEVYGWGNNDYGQLGTGDTMSTPTPVKIDIENVSKISCGDTFSIFLRNGDLYACGENQHYQLGIGNVINSVHSIRRITHVENVVQIESGSRHTLALTRDHQIYSWGTGPKGQLGHGEAKSIFYPRLIDTSIDYVNIQCGDECSLAVSTTGNVYAWGNHEMGGFGDIKTKFQVKPAFITRINPANTFFFDKKKYLFSKVKKIFSPETLTGDMVINSATSIIDIHSLLLEVRCPILLENPDYLRDKSNTLCKILMQYLVEDYFDFDRFIFSDHERDKIVLIIDTLRISKDLHLHHLGYLVQKKIEEIQTPENIVLIIEKAIENDLANEMKFHIKYLVSIMPQLSDEIDAGKYACLIYKMVALQETNGEENLPVVVQSHFEDNFAKIFINGMHTDISLTVIDKFGKEKVFHLHQIILSYSSGYFEMLIRRGQLGKIHHTPLSLSAFGKIIDMFYCKTPPEEWNVKDSIDYLLTQNIYLINNVHMSEFTRIISRITERELISKIIRGLTFEELKDLSNLIEFSGTLFSTMIEESYEKRIELHDSITSSPSIINIDEKLKSLIELTGNNLPKVTQLEHQVAHFESKMIHLESKLDQIIQIITPKRKFNGISKDINVEENCQGKSKKQRLE